MYTNNTIPIDNYLQDKLLITVYHYISDKNPQCYLDSFRGMLIGLFQFNDISFHKFVFIYNFICWLENNTIFSEQENRMFKHFYDTFVADIDDGFKSGLL